MRKAFKIIVVIALALALSGCVAGHRTIRTVQVFGPGGAVVKKTVRIEQTEGFINWSLKKLDGLVSAVMRIK